MENGKPDLICPLLTLGSAQLQTAMNVVAPQQPGIVGMKVHLNTFPCVKEKCGWWNPERQACSIKVLADSMAKIPVELITMGEEIVDNMPKVMGFKKVET